MRDVAVVYLARAAHGPDPVREFLASYQQYPAGLEHDLVVMYKGFRPGPVRSEVEALLKPLESQSLEMRDFGFDLGAYFQAGRTWAHPYFCFLNSFSRLLARDWLLKLANALGQSGIGAAGATGSWESFYSNIVNEKAIGLPRSWVQQLARPLRLAWSRPRFDPFPNPSLRTNAFIMARTVWGRLCPWPMRTKMDALQFESGRRSLTRQIQAQGLQVLVVDREGRAHPPEAWSESRTFRQGRQPGLLVADRRTDHYAQADPAMKRCLSQLAWGDRAQPE